MSTSRAGSVVRIVAIDGVALRRHAGEHRCGRRGRVGQVQVLSSIASVNPRLTIVSPGPYPQAATERRRRLRDCAARANQSKLGGSRHVGVGDSDDDGSPVARQNTSMRVRSGHGHPGGHGALVWVGSDAEGPSKAAAPLARVRGQARGQAARPCAAPCAEPQAASAGAITDPPSAGPIPDPRSAGAIPDPRPSPAGAPAIPEIRGSPRPHGNGRPAADRPGAQCGPSEKATRAQPRQRGAARARDTTSGRAGNGCAIAGSATATAPATVTAGPDVAGVGFGPGAGAAAARGAHNAKCPTRGSC